MAITRIKNNQITDGAVTGPKIATNTITSGLLEADLVYPSNLTVTGNLTVSGTTTTINTTNTVIEDPILVLASQQTTAGAADIGFIGERGTDSNIAFIWDETNDKFVAGFTSNPDSSTTVTITGGAELEVGTLTVLNAGSTFADLHLTGTLQVDGISTLTGLLNANGGIAVDTGNFTVSGTTGAIATTSTLNVTGVSTLGVINATGLASLDAGIDVDGAFTVLDTSGNVSTTGTLNVTGTSTLGVINASGLASLDAGIDVDGQFLVADGTGNVSTTGTLGVTGISTLGVINASGLASLNGGIAVDGTNFTVDGTTGAISTTSTLGVTGISTLGVVNATTLNSSGATTVGTTLGVTGIATFQTDITMVGGAGDVFLINDGTTETFSVDSTNGNTNIVGTVDIGSTLDVVGESTLASATITDLTDNRIVIAGVAGVIEDDANLTFDGTTFEVGTLFDITAASGNTTLGGTLNALAASNLDGTNTFSGFTVVAPATTAGAFVTSTEYVIVTIGSTDFTLIGAASNTIGLKFTASGAGTGTGTAKLSGAIDAGNNKIINVSDPLIAQDAATKAYVDSLTGANSSWTITDGTTPQVIVGGDTLTINGTALEVDVAVSATDTLTIGLPDNVQTTGTLTAGGALTANTTLGVTGISTLGVVNASGLLSANGGIAVDGTAFTVADITGNVATTGTLGVTGISTLGVINASGLASLDGGIDVDGLFTVADGTGNTSTSGTLGATGLASLNGGIAVDGTNFTVDGTTGAIATTSTLNVTGISTLGVINASGLASLDGGIDVDGLFTVADATGNVVAGGTLTVTGTTDLNGTTTIAATTWDAVSVIDAGANKITNVGDPTTAQDATTKAYVDALVASGASWKNPVVDSDLVDIISVNPATPEVTYSLGVGDNVAFIVTASIASLALGTGTTVASAVQGDIVNLTITTAGNGDYSIVETPLTAGDRFIISAEHGTIGATLSAIDVNADTFTLANGDLIEHVTGDGTLAAHWSTPDGRSGNAGGGTEIAQGVTILNSDPDSVHYGHTFLYDQVSNAWVEISGPGAVGAGTNLAYTGNTLNVVQGAGSLLDADKLDGQEGTYYLDYTNFTNLPDPVITLGGDATGAITMTDLAGGTLTVTIVDDSHNHIIANVDGLQTNLDSRLLDTGDTMAGNYTIPTTFDLTIVDAPTAVGHATNKAYVDGLIATGFVVGAGGTTSTIAGGNTLAINGTANEVDVAMVLNSDTVTIGLPDNVQTTGTLTAGGALTANTTLGVTGISTLTGLLNADGGIAVDTGNFTVDGTSGAVVTTSTLDVTGITTITGLSNLNGGIAVDGANFTVSGTTGAISTNSTLGVTGISTLTGLVNANGGIAVDTSAFTVADTTGDVVTAGDLTVAGETDLNGYNTLRGLDADASATSGTLVIGDTYRISTILLVDWSSVGGSATAVIGDVFAATATDATLLGTAELAFISVSGNNIHDVADPAEAQDAATKAYVDATASSGWTITDGSTPSVIAGGDTLTISGTALEVDVVTGVDTLTIGLPDNVTVAGTLTASGALTASTTLGVTGISTLGIINASGLASLDAGIDVDAVFTVADVTGNVFTNGTLAVTGVSTLTGLLNANGGIAVDTSAFTVANTSGNVLTQGTLGVTGISTLAATGVTGTLTVTGQADIDNISINGNAFDATAGTEIVFNELGADINLRVEGDTDVNLLVVDAGTDSVNIGTNVALTDVIFQVTGTTAVMLPKGTTAQRPAVPITGMMRYNTTSNDYEYYDNDTWHGFGTEFTVIASEVFAGTGAQTVFTLATAQTTASCIVSLNGVIQEPTVVYGVVGTTLTFTTAPANTDTIEVRELTTTTSVDSINNGSVSITSGSTDLDITGHMIPVTDITYDLGSASNKWRDLYLSGASIHIGTVQIKSTASSIGFFEADGTTPLPSTAPIDDSVTINGGTY